MVDFNKLKARQKKELSIEPTEIFRRSPKPTGFNDLYGSQIEILDQWFEKRNSKDNILKLHTGGGKTVVGLLMAQSTLNETGDPVLFLCPTVQLVQQTLEKAHSHGIKAVPYESGKELNSDFLNGKAVMVATYSALFNGKSKFGLRGSHNPIGVGAIILDDAHAAFSVIRDSFTIEIKAQENYDRYQSLVDLFRNSFKQIDKLGVLEDVIAGSEFSVLEIPYWAWNEQIDAVREQLRTDQSSYTFSWPLLRDQLHLCHALISRNSITITPILPMLNLFPTFVEAPRRIYMSATISDDSEIIRTFNVEKDSVENALKSKSVAGISERMILVPDLMPFSYEQQWNTYFSKWFAEDRGVGSIILTPSDEKAKNWAQNATIAKGSDEVNELVGKLQEGELRGPVVFSNRYDGIDLPGDSCRFLIMDGLPTGHSSYDMFKNSVLYNGKEISRMLAQRIEQGIGRGARGGGDYCIVFLVGKDVSSWIAKESNFNYLTKATRAQIDMGVEISREINSMKDLGTTLLRSLNRDDEWVSYHADTLASKMDEGQFNEDSLLIAQAERKAIDLWSDGYHEKAITKLEKITIKSGSENDPKLKGWFLQLAARISDDWGNRERADDLQKQAYSNNRNLIKPQKILPYLPLVSFSSQAKSIIKNIGGYRYRMGFLQKFEMIASNLHANTSSGVFEQALCDLANVIGLVAERHDKDGKGPDVLWLLPDKQGFVIEAKNEKDNNNSLNKGEHGQLLVAAEWFENNYPGYDCVRVSVLPQSLATSNAMADRSYALTFEKLQSLISDTRSLLRDLCESQLDDENLEIKCNQLLEDSRINSSRLKENYLVKFNQ